jgi:hypothetical protein
MVSVLSTVFGRGGALTDTVVAGGAGAKLFGAFEQDANKNAPANNETINDFVFIQYFNINACALLIIKGSYLP